MLTFKRILAAWLLWCGADLIAMWLLTTTRVISVQGRPSSLSGEAQFLVWLLISIALVAASKCHGRRSDKPTLQDSWCA